MCERAGGDWLRGDARAVRRGRARRATCDGVQTPLGPVRAVSVLLTESLVCLVYAVEYSL